MMRPFFTKLIEAFNVDDPQYRAHYLAADTRQTSIAIAVWQIPVLLFTYADYGIFGLSPMFTALLTLRLVFCAFSLYTISVLRKVTTPPEYDQIFLRWAAFTIAITLFINYKWASFAPPNGVITILIIFSAYMLFGSKLSVRLAPPLTLSVGNLLLQWWISEPDSSYSWLMTAVAVLMANILGIIFSSLLQMHRYAEFKSRREENRIKEELIRLASVDDLTGVFNRRTLIQLATEAFKRFRRNHQPFSVLMVDIDHFKNLNDNFGHDAGDLILSKFVAHVMNNIEVNHIWGRLGGDEFVLVLPNLPGEKAKLVAEQLRLGLTDPVIWQKEQLSFTVSIGLTERRDQDESFEGLLSRADQALYHAKRNGRNRTEVL
ncbi:MAG: GGDEF domain-containing protein [Bacillota bacterium]